MYLLVRVLFSVFSEPWTLTYLVVVTGPGRATERQQAVHHVWIAAKQIKRRTLLVLIQHAQNPRLQISNPKS